MREIDTLIHARWLLPIQPLAEHEHWSIAIDGGEIVACLPRAQSTQFKAKEVVELKNHVVLPGFVNCHTHAAMTLFRGIADDKSLMDWLQNFVWPLEQKFASEEFVRVGTELAIAEMIQSGTTCFNDMYFFPDVVSSLAQSIGIRASVGLIMLDFPTPWGSGPEEYFQKAQQVFESLNDKSLVRATLAPHAPYTVSDEPLEKIKILSEKWQIPIQMHIHETAEEVKESRPIERLYKMGLLGPNLQAVHMTQLTDAEIELIAKTKTQVIHCPESNLKLASGVCLVTHLFDKNINVALGTDGTASNNDLDMMGEMRTAGFLAKLKASDATVLPAEMLLRMATLGGARAMGLEDTIGSIEVGKQADLVAIDLSAFNSQPVYNVAANIVYSAKSSQVSDVWIAGKRVLKDKQLTTIDVQTLRNNINHWREKILTKEST